MLRKTILVLSLTIFLLAMIPKSLALNLNETDIPKPSILPNVEIMEANDENNPESAATQTLIIYIGGIVSKVLLFAGALTIGFLIFSGTNYIFAFGKDERIERGKRGTTWSIIGLILILLSYAIVRGVITIISQVDSGAISMYTPLTFLS